MASASGERLTREEFFKKKQLDEARKAGTAPAELDEDGKEINPHIPQYIAQAPWYFGSTKPGLKHQKSSIQHEPTARLGEWYARGQQLGDAPTKFRKGACENCGSMTHTAKTCCERPRKERAKFSGRDLRPDEVVKEVKLDWAGKRDRWNGYDPSEHARLMALHEKIDHERRELRRQKEEEGGAAAADEAKASGGEGDEDLEGEGYNNAPIQKLDPKTRTTVRNLRMREDTAKYLRNLDPNSAYYDPKTRSMRENPTPGVPLQDLDFAGDNFVRASGDTQKLAEAQLEAIRAEQEGAAGDVPHLLANPSAAEMMHKETKARKEKLRGSQHEKLLERYGGSEGVEQLPKELVFAQTEAYVEYSKAGKPIKGDIVRQQQQHAASKWEEDVLTGNHTAVWGSWWHEGHWGYGCCHSLVKNSYCTGAAGRAVAAATMAVDGESDADAGSPDAPQKTLVEEHAEKGAEAAAKKAEEQEEEHKEKLRKAFESEARRQREGGDSDDAGDGKGRKRKYGSQKADSEVTPEEMEAYHALRVHRDDPMRDFVGKDDDGDDGSSAGKSDHASKRARL
eukprot:m51a1_g3852 putative pre-mrna-splicing factor slu7 (566) ;mRNA; f:386440-388445